MENDELRDNPAAGPATTGRDRLVRALRVLGHHAWNGLILLGQWGFVYGNVAAWPPLVDDRERTGPRAPNSR